MSLFPTEAQVLDLPKAEVIYYPNFLEVKEVTSIFESLQKETPWQQDDITVFGKIYAQPRLTALYANNNLPYSYSNITMHPHSFTPLIDNLRKQIEKHTEATYTACLLNLYRDGKDSNGWHSDDEKELGRNPTIASLSLGASRVFKFRSKEEKSKIKSLVIEPGSLLLMKGETQHNWQHQLPKTSKKVTARINLTFRKIIAKESL